MTAAAEPAELPVMNIVIRVTAVTDAGNFQIFFYRVLMASFTGYILMRILQRIISLLVVIELPYFPIRCEMTSLAFLSHAQLMLVMLLMA